MNIYEVTKYAQSNNCWIMNDFRDPDAYCFYPASDDTFHTQYEEQIKLDAEDCASNGWFLIKDGSGIRVPSQVVLDWLKKMKGVENEPS